MPHKVATIVFKTMPASFFPSLPFRFCYAVYIQYNTRKRKSGKKKRTKKKRGRPGNAYRKAGNFRGRKLSRLGGKILADKLLRIARWCRQKTPRPPISRRKLSRISHKPRNSRKTLESFPLYGITSGECKVNVGGKGPCLPTSRHD